MIDQNPKKKEVKTEKKMHLVKLPEMEIFVFFAQHLCSVSIVVMEAGK